MSTHTIAGMAVEVSGDGTPVICIHGLGGTSNTFTPLAPAFSAMRVVRPDLPCAGRSANIDKPSIAGFITSIVNLADTLGIKSAHFIGHSMGTLVCQHIAAEHPELVRSMALLGALTEPTEVGRDAFRKRAATARAGGMSEVADTVANNSTSADSKTRNPAALAFVRETILRQCPEGYARCCEALADAYAADHARIRCPVLLMTGDEDASTPVSMARELATRIEGARVVTLTRCGHWPSIERADEVNAELRRFF